MKATFTFIVLKAIYKRCTKNVDKRKNCNLIKLKMLKSLAIEKCVTCFCRPFLLSIALKSSKL